jgi:tellurite resistance protein
MEDQETLQYLANVFVVARSDGSFGAREEAAMEAIRLAIKAKKSELNKASKLAASEDFTLVPTGRYSERIRNIEDMIFVALLDGALADKEKRVITKFAKEAGCIQEQINQILRETKKRIHNDSSEIACPSCKVTVLANAKFCPSCGVELGEAIQASATQVEFKYPAKGISIEFAESSSASFGEALKSAKAAPDFQKCKRERKIWYLASWNRDQVSDAAVLAKHLKGIRNRKAFIDGEPKGWDEAFGFLWCYSQRQEAYRPESFCFGLDEKRLNVWGCKQARMEWTDWADWFSYGHFRKKDVFVFDKARIWHEIHTNLHKVSLCPCLRPKLVEQVLALLPAEVSIGSRSGWKYKESYEQTPTSIKVVEKEKDDGYTYTNEFYSDGVRPVGHAVAKQILTKAFKACGIVDVKVKELTG